MRLPDINLSCRVLDECIFYWVVNKTERKRGRGTDGSLFPSVAGVYRERTGAVAIGSAGAIKNAPRIDNPPPEDDAAY